MAFTISSTFEQIGKRFWMTAHCTTDGTDVEEPLVDFSADLNASPPECRNQTFTAFKVIRIAGIGVGAGGATANHEWELAWEAGTDRNLMHLSAWRGFQFDFSKFPQGGLPNPKASSYTGDLLLKVGGTAANGDSVYITLEGELIP